MPEAHVVASHSVCKLHEARLAAMLQKCTHKVSNPAVKGQAGQANLKYRPELQRCRYRCLRSSAVGSSGQDHCPAGALDVADSTFVRSFQVLLMYCFNFDAVFRCVSTLISQALPVSSCLSTLCVRTKYLAHILDIYTASIAHLRLILILEASKFYKKAAQPNQTIFPDCV